VIPVKKDQFLFMDHNEKRIEQLPVVGSEHDKTGPHSLTGTLIGRIAESKARYFHFRRWLVGPGKCYLEMTLSPNCALDWGLFSSFP